jgi:hypothetical protein
MKNLILALALTCALTTTIHADPLSKKAVSADAKWLVHLDLDNLRKAKIGEFLTKEVLEKLVEAKLSALKAQAKLDVDVDLKKIASITAYGTDLQKNPDANAVLLIRTGHNIEKVIDGVIQALAGQIPDESKRPIKKLQQEPVVMYSVGGELFAAIQGNDLLILSKSRSQIDKARTVLAGATANIATSSAFSGYPALENSFFFLGIAEAFNENSGIPAQAKVLQMADGGRVVLGEKADRLFLNLALRAKTPELTSQIQQILQGLVALASLSQSENQDLQQLTQSMKVASDKNLVTVNVEFPLDRALKHLGYVLPKAGK